MHANDTPSAASGFAACQLKTSEGSSGESVCCKHTNYNDDNTNFCLINILKPF